MAESRIRTKERLASGGMAELVLAEQELAPGIVRTVVVKRLLPDHRGDPEYSTMLLDEARITLGLSHPNVIQLLDLVHEAGEPWLVFEHLSGLSLREVLLRLGELGHRVLPVSAAAAVVLTLAETLGYVHSARDASGRWLEIVHRDLNPSNVLLGRHGGSKLIDFGIARGEMRVYETATGTLKGTCGYMAPEQLVEHARIDHRVDVFALGVMMYELFVGEHPFATEQPLAFYDKLRVVDYAPPAELRAVFARAGWFPGQSDVAGLVLGLGTSRG